MYTMDDVEFQVLAALFHIICLAETTDLRAFMVKPDELDLLFCISHLLDLRVRGWSLLAKAVYTR